MPIVSPLAVNPLADGRQSERAMVIRRGVQRLLAEMGARVLPELSLATGRRADLVALTRKALMLRVARAGAARLLAAELAGVPVPALDGESE